MSGCIKISGIRKIGVRSLSLPLTYFPFQESVASGGSFLCGPGSHTSFGPSLDKSLKEDKSLCLVRALRYYLDRTKDLRKVKDLVFVFFWKSFYKDIVPATISSWIKQMVLLCYQLSDEEAQNLYQVRAHDVSHSASVH